MLVLVKLWKPRIPAKNYNVLSTELSRVRTRTFVFYRPKISYGWSSNSEMRQSHLGQHLWPLFWVAGDLTFPSCLFCSPAKATREDRLQIAEAVPEVIHLTCSNHSHCTRRFLSSQRKEDQLLFHRRPTHIMGSHKLCSHLRHHLLLRCSHHLVRGPRDPFRGHATFAAFSATRQSTAAKSNNLLRER
jgi:hypothetical protein